MLENKILLRNYKLYKKKFKSANVIKRFEKDDYLIHTLKTNSYSKNDNKIPQQQKDIKDLLSYIYKKILLENDPKIKYIKEENDEFKKEYQITLDNFKNKYNIIFKNIIKEYCKRGYKIPNITYKHNIFKINSLIEDNIDKIELILKEDIKKEYPKQSVKTMDYLKKIKYLINYFLSKDEDEEREDISKLSIPKKRPSLHINESKQDLKKSIEKLKLLIKKLPLMNIVQKENLLIKRKPSFADSINFFNSKSKLSNKENKNSNSNSIKVKKNIVLTDSAFNTIVKNNDPSNFLTIRTKSNVSNKSFKSENSTKDIINKNNKIKQKEFLLFSNSDNKNDNLDIISNKNSKHLINLKTINNKENNFNTINNEDKDKDKDRESIIYNRNFNTIDLYNNNNNNLNKFYNNNNVYSNTSNHPFLMSLKKSLKNNKTNKIQKIKNIQKLSKFIRSSFILSKNQKLKNEILEKIEEKKKKI